MLSTQNQPTGSVIELGVGHPSLNMLPLRELEQAAAHRFAQGDASFLQYGAELGDSGLRRELAAYLRREYSLPAQPVEVLPEELMISGGVSQALDLCCAMLSVPGDTILVEDPTYFLSLDIFRNHQLKVVPLPVGSGGMDLDALEELLRQHRPRLLYTVPTHQNPTGATMPAAHRERLAQLAQENDFYVLADEVYHLLTFGGTPPLTFSAYVGTGKVLSLGSFSKILAPGSRLGWIHAAPELLARLSSNGMVVSGGGFSPLGSGLIRSVFELGLLDPYLQNLRTVLKSRAEALSDALEPLRSLGTDFQRPGGGYFIWLKLPPGVDSAALLDRAVENGVRYQPGPKFSPAGEQRDRARLCFAYYPGDELRGGVRRLERALTTPQNAGNGAV